MTPPAAALALPTVRTVLVTRPRNGGGDFLLR
jgi:hypothetical protein